MPIKFKENRIAVVVIRHLFGELAMFVKHEMLETHKKEIGIDKDDLDIQNDECDYLNNDDEKETNKDRC